MKRVYLILAMTLLYITTLSAQEKGQWTLGPAMKVYANTGMGGVVGLGPAARANLLDGLRLEPSVMILTSRGSSVDVSCNVHYTFEVAPKWYLYPIAGISFNDIKDFTFGFNLGAGFDCRLGYHWDLYLNVNWLAECSSSLRNPVVSTLGIMYRF